MGKYGWKIILSMALIGCAIFLVWGIFTPSKTMETFIITSEVVGIQTDENAKRS